MSSSTVAATIPHFIAFDSGHKSASTAVFTFALLSTLVLSVVLLSVIWVVCSAAFRRAPSENLAREVFFRSQLGQCAFSLLLSKWISGVGGLMSIKWINEGGVTSGPTCIAQGATNEIGEFGSSFFVVAIGLHTFNTLVLRNRHPQWVGTVVITLGWAAALAAGAGPIAVSNRTSGPLYNVNKLSCGFSKASPIAHMLLFFVPVFLASLLSAIVYSLIFLILRGTLTINGGLRFQLDPERRLRLYNQTYEEYQRFVHSVARALLWLPISFILALFPSSIVQSMDMSGIAVSPGSIAFSYILAHLDSIFDVIILFNVLRVLGLAVKSPYSMSLDPEKLRSERGPVSRPTYDWNPQSTSTPTSQSQITRTAPPAHPPSTMQGSAPRPLTLGRPPFQAHKKTESTGSSTRLLTPEPTSRSHSLNGSKIPIASNVVRKPVARASVLDAELSLPPLAMRKHTETGPISQPLTVDPLSQNGLTPYSYSGHFGISGGLSPIPGTPAIPQSAAPFLEVTLHSPAVNNSSPGTDGAGSVISMYFSRKPTESSELPPFPAPAVPGDSSIGLALSNYGPPAQRVPAVSSVVGSQAVLPREGVVYPPKATLSIAAVGGRGRSSAVTPGSPPAPVTSPADSTDASHYSGTEAGSPPPAPKEPQLPPIPVLRPTQPLRFSRVATRPNITSERRLLDSPRSSRTSLDRSMQRTLPTPPSRPGGQPSPSVYSHARSSYSRQASSSSSISGYR